MGLTSSLLVILLLCLVYPHSWAFVLNAGVQNEDNVNKLAEALRLIERERRRISDEEPVGRVEDEIFWNSESEALPNQDVNDFLNRLLSSEQYDVESSKTSTQIKSDNEVENDLKTPETTAVNKAELQTIFNPLPDEEEEPSSEMVSGREENMTLDKDDKAEVKRESDAQEQLSDEQVETLLKAADNVELNDMMKHDDEDDSAQKSMATNEPVTKEEVSNILQDSNRSENDDLETEESDWLVPQRDVEPHGFLPNEDWPGYNDESNINKEWLLTEYLKEQPDSKVSRKSKRSDNTPVVQDETEEETRADEIEALIGKFIEYEDNQNQNLIRALDLATRAQTEKTENYIPEEISYIRKAIEDEEVIHQLKKFLRTESKSISDETDDSDETEELLNEKRDQQMDDEEDDVDTTPDDNQVDIPDNIDPDVAERIRQYVMGQEVRNDEDTTDQNEDQWYDKPVNQEGLIEKDIYINPFLRKLIEKFRDEQLRRRVIELKNRVEEEELEPLQDRMLEQYLPDDTDQQIEDEITREEMEELEDLPEAEMKADTDACAAVEDLVDDCAFADRQGLGLDDEAKDLCNRHQLCYLCGAEHGMTSASCNQGYLTEANVLCADDEGCKDEAAALYILMMDHHVFIPRGLTNPVCEVQCAEDLIVNDLDKK